MGQLVELFLRSDGTAGRIRCPAGLIPAPGQYVLAREDSPPGSLPDAPLPVSVYPAGASPDGFLAASPLPAAWKPGIYLHLRGPLGRGFSLPPRARRVALWARDGSPACLLPLIPSALKSGAAVVLLLDEPPQDLPEEVEVHPASALGEIAKWADYLAIDVRRESLASLREDAGAWRGQSLLHVEVLVHAPMPCGGLAECGACAVTGGREWRMACKDGPVLGWEELRG